MITLFTFGPFFGLPDPSPFVIKAEMLLKLSKVPYEAKAKGMGGAPKGKLPYITDGDVKIADSTFIRLHLEKKHGIDFDPGLTAAEKGIAWSVEKMLEDNLYWAVVNERWMDDANFDKGPRRFFDAIPAAMRVFIVPLVRRTVRKNLHAHGMGRHSNEEITELAGRVIDSLAAVLGEKPYLMGTRPCGADATVFAFVVSLLSPYFNSQIRPHALRHANLIAYRDRMLREYFPDLK
ncbi:MAG TPA: glutathione S-transferase family protein [Steroidobacteraceae bacterium]|nr:glutathione S-transferase family protein [Steroidobacteraceae bacterium]